MKYNISILSAFILSILISSCNNKEKSWSTSVLSTIEVSYNEVVVQADYNLYRNKNYVNVGICVSEEANPDINNKLHEDQLLDSDHIDYTIENLFSDHEYHVRSFIETSSIGILYSDDFTFSTLPLPEPPCEITEGVIDFDFFNMDMADLTIDPTSDDYKMGTSCDLGDLDFTFAAEPKTGIYKTVGPTSYLSPDEVRVDGILGGTFSCYYGGYSDEGLYVINDGNGNISIAFCDMNMSTSMSCSSYSAAGEVHN